MTATRERRRRRGVGALAALLAVAALAPAACSSDGQVADGPDAEGGRLDDVATFALALGVDPLDDDAIERLGRYDLVVVDGEGADAEAVAALQEDGTVVLAYLSVGTLEPGRPWFAEAEEQGWLLDHWDDWDEWYAAVAEPGLRDLLVGVARTELDKGFDGLFLDNVDMVESHPDQAEGMDDLVASLDQALGKDRFLFSQNGDASVDEFADHLDGWNREDVSGTYDFDAEAYAEVDAEDGDAATATLRRLREQGLLVTATDYAEADDDPLVATARDRACDAGAVPFASDIGLTRVPDPPARCG